MDVMDSLLMVRGIRTLLRGAVAASSAIFFFSLANMVPFQRLSMHRARLHVVWPSFSSQSRCVPRLDDRCSSDEDNNVLHLEKEKDRH